MRFQIQPTSSEPIKAQIIRQVREALATGKTRADQRLPTVRELALELVINPNTIAAAYREMERAGIVYTRRGVGTFVAPPKEQVPSGERQRLLKNSLQNMLTEAFHLGFTEEELLDRVRIAVREFRLPKQSPEGGRK
jgi:GntR family transcriptional regulator